MTRYDAVVVGAGPNGLSAAVELTRAGMKVLVVEQAAEIGGGARTEELTLPGFKHDVCSAIHPLGIASPFFRELGLDVDWVQPPIPVSHPLGGERSGAVLRDLAGTAHIFGPDDERYLRLMRPLVEAAGSVIDDVLGPIQVPKSPRRFVRLASRGALPVSAIAARFTSDEARAVLAGLAAHAIAPFGSPLTGGVALLFAVIAHTHGWPLVRGGSRELAGALAGLIRNGGGEIETGRLVGSLDELPPARVMILDVMPGAALRIGGSRVDPRARRRLIGRKAGPAVFKLDYALDGPIPWSDPHSPDAGTVHIGGTWEEVAEAEGQVHAGRHPERPFVLVAQQSRFDSTRAPDGKHTAWAYCHVPNGSTVDMTDAIDAQIERFAPGFRDLILHRSTMNARELEAHNPNYVGGDIGGGGFGIQKVIQLGLVGPYRLGEGLFLCSSATPPGAGVHGMCGFHAARAAIGESSHS
jgi:phytoene dehydrogenase-like protein